MNEDDFWQRVSRHAATIAPTVLGLDEAGAKATIEGAGCQFRVASRDGTRLPLRRDKRPNRINITTKDGKVIAADVY